MSAPEGVVAKGVGDAGVCIVCTAGADGMDGGMPAGVAAGLGAVALG